MNLYTAAIYEAAEFSNENVALMACDAACSELDAVFQPIRLAAGRWVVRVEDYVTGGALMGYLTPQVAA
jgi:hypothetical protein